MTLRSFRKGLSVLLSVCLAVIGPATAPVPAFSAQAASRPVGRTAADTAAKASPSSARKATPSSAHKASPSDAKKTDALVRFDEDGFLLDGELIDDLEEIPEVIPEEIPEEKLEEAFEAQTVIDGVEITVSAPEGVFPAGSELSVTKVSGKDDLLKIEDAVSPERPEDQNVAVAYPFDIKVLLNGEEVVPYTEEGKVKVSFAFASELPAEANIQVYHVSDESDGSLNADSLDTEISREDMDEADRADGTDVKDGSDGADDAAGTDDADGLKEMSETASGEVTAPERMAAARDSVGTSAEVSGDEARTVVTVETDSFSFYVVEFTYGKLTYVLDGGQQVLLSVILESLGISGKADQVAVSSEDLLGITKTKNGSDWMVTAKKPFATEEWMDVTIGGAVWRIAVTDSGSAPLIYAMDGKTYQITDFSEKYTALFFSDTTCRNTINMIDAILQAVDKGVSVKPVFMDVEDTNANLASYIAERPGVIGAWHSSYYSLMWSYLGGSGSLTTPLLVIYDNSTGEKCLQTTGDAETALLDFLSQNAMDDLCADVAYSGVYYTETDTKILNRINAIRREACREGIVFESGGTPLSLDDYVPVRWSSDMEEIARLRAAEASIKMGHQRPNNGSPFSVKSINGISTNAEVLAWNYDSSPLMTGIEQWYEEKSYLEAGDYSSASGHYRILIDPNYKYIGVGTFRLDGSQWWTTAGELSGKSGLDETKNASSGNITVPVQVFSGDMKLSIKGSAKMAVGKSIQLKAQAEVTQGGNTTSGTASGVKWSSSNTSVLTVSSDGKAKGIKPGTAVVTVAKGSTKAALKITVYKPLTGVTLSKTAVKLQTGKTVKLTAAITPADAGGPVYTWKSSNTKIATVTPSADGKTATVKAAAPGKATVTLSVKDALGNTKTASCTVTAGTPMTSVKTDVSSLYLAPGTSGTVKVTLTPAGASYGTVISWKSRNTKIAAVTPASDKKSASVRMVAKGSAQIEITVKDLFGNVKTLVCQVKVIQDGWVTDGDKKYYYQNGVMVKGWKTISGAYYYFDPSTGVMQKGERTINKIPCYFDPASGKGLHLGWRYIGGKYYWYEKGQRQGTRYDPNGVMGDGTVRGREIFDPVSKAWYWLDAVYNGAKALNKEVWMPYIYQSEKPGSTRGKWVLYDSDGAMVKGWYTNNKGTYYYDLRTGAMLKGNYQIDGARHSFNERTGILEKSVEMNTASGLGFSSDARVIVDRNTPRFYLKGSAFGSRGISKILFEVDAPTCGGCINGNVYYGGYYKEALLNEYIENYLNHGWTKMSDSDMRGAYHVKLTVTDVDGNAASITLYWTY